jgi:dienelactone hydrolase
MVLPLIPICAFGLPVLGIWGVLARVTGQDWPKLRNMFFFPLGGTSRGPQHRLVRQRLLSRLNGQPVRLVTRDKRAISAVWAEPRYPARADAAVIIIGANAMVLDDLIEYAEWYLGRLRVPVLLISIWGYPDPTNPAVAASKPAAVGGSESGAPDETTPLNPSPAASEASLCPTELTAYLDGEAAFAYLNGDRQIGSESILVHGVSIGGAIGAAIALNHPGVHLTFDQPFDTLKEVTRHMTANVVDGFVTRYLQSKGWLTSLRVAKVCLSPPLSRVVAFLLVRMCFKKGLGGPADGCAPTDMLDNVGKASRIRGDVFVFYAGQDEMMHPEAPKRILSARYKLGARDADAELRRRSAPMDGGHMSFFGEHDEACAVYERYLRDTGYVHSDEAGSEGAADV